MKENQKKKTIILIVSLITILIAITGISFAAFRFTKAGNKQNVITLGTLKLTLTEGAEINITDALPMSDADALTSDSYSFTLKNEGTVPVVYSIYLDNVAISSPDVKLDDSFLKYSFDINGTAGSAKLLTSLGTGSSRTLTSGTIAAGATNQYKLRIWLRSDIDMDETTQGQVWKGKIRLEGEQVK